MKTFSWTFSNKFYGLRVKSLRVSGRSQRHVKPIFCRIFFSTFKCCLFDFVVPKVDLDLCGRPDDIVIQTTEVCFFDYRGLFLLNFFDMIVSGSQNGYLAICLVGYIFITCPGMACAWFYSLITYACRLIANGQHSLSKNDGKFFDSLRFIIIVLVDILSTNSFNFSFSLNFNFLLNWLTVKQETYAIGIPLQKPAHSSVLLLWIDVYMKEKLA